MSAIFSNINGYVREHRLEQNGDGKVRILVPCMGLFWRTVKVYVVGYYAGGEWRDRWFDSKDAACCAIWEHNKAVRDARLAEQRATTWKKIDNCHHGKAL